VAPSTAWSCFVACNTNANDRKPSMTVQSMQSAHLHRLSKHAPPSRDRNFRVGGARSTWKKRGNNSGHLALISPSQNSVRAQRVPTTQSRVFEIKDCPLEEYTAFVKPKLRIMVVTSRRYPVSSSLRGGRYCR